MIQLHFKAFPINYSCLSDPPFVLSAVDEELVLAEGLSIAAVQC